MSKGYTSDADTYGTYSGYGRFDVTVGGVRCRRGSTCRPNRELGYWFCETEEDKTSWDYCCRPSHPCGFSDGFGYPWCYVGTEAPSGNRLETNQWRPCSDRYAERPYAYVHRQAPPNVTVEAKAELVETFDGAHARTPPSQQLAPLMRVRSSCKNATSPQLLQPVQLNATDLK